MFLSRLCVKLVNRSFIYKKFSSNIDLLPVSALDIYKKSCYYNIDYKINEEADVKQMTGMLKHLYGRSFNVK